MDYRYEFKDALIKADTEGIIVNTIDSGEDLHYNIKIWKDEDRWVIEGEKAEYNFNFDKEFDAVEIEKVIPEHILYTKSNIPYIKEGYYEYKFRQGRRYTTQNLTIIEPKQ
jgi:hypothetical protein